MNINRGEFKENIKLKLKEQFGKTISCATKQEIFDAVSRAAMDYVLDNWLDTKKTYAEEEVKQAYYLSAEFLMGRALSNNLVNMLIEEDVAEVLNELGFNYNEVEDTEPDAGLGNGGLGRLAACFLDSLASLKLPGHGYGIRYRYGMFEQKIIDGYQVEFPDNWLKNGDPWSVKRKDESIEIKFGGKVTLVREENGRERFKRVDAEVITAVPYDMPIVGYNNKTVNTLRLWEAEAEDGFDLQLFNDQEYIKAMSKESITEDISRVLYPNDSGPSGKALRLKQQYFFVSASVQDIVRNYKKKYGNDFSKFAEKVAMQLNDTHPVVAIPELMRIFLDWEGLNWDTAWDITTKACAYTNHTILAEALEKWPIDLFSGLLPRIYQIVEEINRRFLAELNEKYPGDWARTHRMGIIADGMVKMAWLAIVGSHSVNGVAALHTEILKNQELKDWYELYPEKFNNKTNGVTQRRWLLKSNKELAKLLNEKIGTDWAINLSELKKFEKFIDDEEVVNRFMKIKYENKVKLAEYIKEHNNIDVDPNSIFDVQVKRLHEYKRQLLDVLNIMALYNRLKENPDLDIYPRTFIFGAKAASGYRRAKLVIKLINSIANKINNDQSIKGKIKVVFIENYRVSVAEKIFPASDVSEQISTAGKEASGTGNMKFMINGALTIGTLDGANVEIVEEAGEENAFIFGLKADEVLELNKTNSYNPWDEYNRNLELKKVIDQLVDGTYSPDNREIFRELYDSLMYGVEGNRPDQYYVLRDFASYAEAQRKIGATYRDKIDWAKKAMINVANGGKFSSDRTIQQYADEIWEIKATEVK
ncbi:glycogen/starch/alpha-glucan phosphorylase [Haliovirga abyssi]|uniref:Alpha-1,4 glucan phosphorylase n=1 Tax=Haliovirga abyssi TaxID=2996794 RepID=A0AAU9DEW6_9FUSO|nr:glycogen/starch/alpha-glucan phosphorylase [Haliovirga abyssi]BDU50738.1 glycosyl transferase family 35 [Haliovirga abyssi]